MIDTRLIVCAVGSVLFHYGLERGLEQLPPLGVAPPPPEKIQVQVLEPEQEPPPEPPKPEEPKPPEPKPVPHEIPHARPAPAPIVGIANDVPAEHPAVVADTTEEPVYGVNMSSTSTVGTGPELPVGNTTKVAGPSAKQAVKPLAEPIAAAEATKLPLPQGQCFGKYTDEARAAGVEGTVVLDLIVGEDGRVRDVRVAQGLAHGLSEAAVAALRDCRFTPGERDGKPVPVRVRGFKIHFVLDTGT